MQGSKQARGRPGVRIVQRGAWILLGIMAVACPWQGITRLQAEEPYRQFLEKLRGQQMFDLALFYLDELEKNQSVDATFANEIPLERATLYQEAAATMALRSPQRATRLDEAERAFEKFLNQNKDHPRRSEARMGLGNLLLARADEVKGDDDAKVDKPEAIKFYGEAEKLFESTLKELEGILTGLQGARIDANDEAGKTLRDKYRGDYRRAELLAAFATEQKGRSHAKGSPQWKKELEKAQAAYTEFYSHEKERQEARNYAIYYRAGIQRDFGKIDDAVDGYSRILGEEGIDELRPLQFKSLGEIIKLWASKEQNKYPAALELITKWEKQIRPDERHTQDVIDFTLAAARAKLAYAAELQSKDANDRSISKLRKDTRETLQKLVRINGPHQQHAREMMAELGMSKERSAQPIELPQVKSFDEAMKEASNRIELMQTETITQQTLEQGLQQAADDTQKKEMSDQLIEVNTTLDRARDQAGELLKVAMRMFPQGGEISELTDTRYRLAFVELQRGNPWDAIAIGEFLAQTNAGSATGLQCATVALAGYGRLITDADAELQKSLTEQLQPFAEFMVTTWPDSSEAQAAASTLVQLAMNSGDFAKAQTYLSKLPAGTGKVDKLRRDIGLVLAGQYFQDKAKSTKGEPVPADLDAKRDSAIQQLEMALKDIEKDQIDSRTIEAINSIVRLYLSVGKIETAAQWMNNPDFAPVELIRTKPDIVSERLVKLDSYRTALQATVSQLGSVNAGDAGGSTLKQIEQLIAELREAAGSDADGQQMLTSIFVKVARDLQDLVSSSDSPATKQKLAEGMVLLCKQVASSSDEFATKFWAGQTLSQVASALDDSGKQTKVTLQRESTNLMQNILDKEAQSPGWIKTPNGDLLVRVTLAQALRQAGQFQQAIDQIAKVLAKNEATLDMQIAAAEIYQAWGDSGALANYDLAVKGALANGKGGKLVWGWGKLSQALSKKKDLANQFFLSRYNLAVCYYRHALALKDKTKQSELLSKAEREIGSTVFLYPDMGDPDNYKRFDVLLKNIQKELGKPTVGLTGAAKQKS